RQLFEYVVTACDLNQLGYPTDAADQWIVPFLEVDPRSQRARHFGGDVHETPLIALRERLRLFRRTEERTERANHRQDAGNVPLVEGMHSNAGADKIGSDRRLEIGKGKNEVGLKRKNLGDVCRRESRDTWFLAPHLRWTARIAGYADNAMLSAKRDTVSDASSPKP